MKDTAHLDPNGGSPGPFGGVFQGFQGQRLRQIPTQMPRSYHVSEDIHEQRNTDGTSLENFTWIIKEKIILVKTTDDQKIKRTVMEYHLTKSKYLKGQRCPKRLWYEENQQDENPKETLSQQRNFDQGTEVGVFARDSFPGGVFIDTNAPLHAVKQTEAAIKRGDTCIFEATFIFNDVLVKCDILKKDANSWRIIEVKKSTVNGTVNKASKIVKKYLHYLHDLAIQKYVLTGHGLSISKTELMLINREICVYPDLSNLFSIVGVTDQVEPLMESVQSEIETFTAILDRDNPPQVPIGEHCEKPYVCPFKEQCWTDIPKNSIYSIPGLYWSKKNELIERGILHLEDVPDPDSLNDQQQAYVNSVLNGEPEIDTVSIRHLLSNLEYPIHFLDFETDNPAIPRFDGLRPYPQFPFQYSCHILQSDGSDTHQEYLHMDTTDPRLPLVISLLNDVSTTGSVVVYNDRFEKGVLKNLAAAFPEHASALESIVDRLWDLLDIFEHHYMHPDFCGSTSIKDVLPVLVPTSRYEDLEVQDGTEAQALWNLMLETEDETKKNKWIHDLKAYCKMDTRAMLDIYKVLCEL